MPPPHRIEFGVLGRKWIRENRIILDFSHKKVVVAPDKLQQDSVAKTLTKANFISVSLEWKESGYYAEVVVNDNKSKFTVSTVSESMIDSSFVMLAGITMIKTNETFGGPSGERGCIYKPVKKLY